MKYYCIGDQDTVVGFRFAGIEGEVVESVAQAREALRRAAGRADVGVVIVPDPLAQALRKEIDEIRFARPQPAIVEIPGPQGFSPERPKLVDLVREALGVRL